MLASVGYGKPYTAEKLFVEKDLHFANFVQSQDMKKNPCPPKQRRCVIPEIYCTKRHHLREVNSALAIVILFAKKWVLLVSVVYLKLQFQSAYSMWVVHNWFRIRRQETSEKNPCIQLCIRFKIELTGMKDLILLFVIILLIYSYWTEKLACI